MNRGTKDKACSCYYPPPARTSNSIPKCELPCERSASRYERPPNPIVRECRQSTRHQWLDDRNVHRTRPAGTGDLHRRSIQSGTPGQRHGLISFRSHVDDQRYDRPRGSNGTELRRRSKSLTLYSERAAAKFASTRRAPTLDRAEIVSSRAGCLTISRPRPRRFFRSDGTLAGSLGGRSFLRRPRSISLSALASCGAGLFCQRTLGNGRATFLLESLDRGSRAFCGRLARSFSLRIFA